MIRTTTTAPYLDGEDVMEWPPGMFADVTLAQIALASINARVTIEKTDGMVVVYEAVR